MAKNTKFFYKVDKYDDTVKNYVEDNDNNPVFDTCPGKFTIKFTELDGFGRCGPAYACLDTSHVTETALLENKVDKLKEGSGKIVVDIVKNGIENDMNLEDIKKKIHEKTGLNTTDPNAKETFLNIGDLEKYKKTERANIDTIYPTGWIQEKYPGVVSGMAREGQDANPYLYQRAHLLRHAFTLLNSEPRNLVTGTQWLNTIGMLSCENEVLSYLVNNRNIFIQYRVTPIFDETDLLPYAIRMEALSTDDKLKFNRVIPNVEPGIMIDYATGRSRIG